MKEIYLVLSTTGLVAEVFRGGSSPKAEAEAYEYALKLNSEPASGNVSYHVVQFTPWRLLLSLEEAIKANANGYTFPFMQVSENVAAWFISVNEYKIQINEPTKRWRVKDAKRRDNDLNPIITGTFFDDAWLKNEYPEIISSEENIQNYLSKINLNIK